MTQQSVLVSPSLMCADAANLESGVRDLEAIAVDLLHFDIMDAHFVPNLPMGLGVIEALEGRTSIPFDVHLMVENNDWFVERAARAGASQIAVHAESSTHLDRTLTLIRDRGVRAGVALNPATPLKAIEFVLDRLDFVLLMTVNPGFAGQELVPSALSKITACRRILDQAGCNVPISVDGNVSFENIPSMIAAGADILVAGTSSLYRAGGTLRQNADRLRVAIREGLSRRIRTSREGAQRA